MVAHRTIFCRQYLTEYEPRCQQCVQLSLESAQTIKDADIEVTFCYANSSMDGEPWIEYHFDNWDARTRSNQQLQDLHHTIP
jgi:hypothetical protein